MGAANSLRPGRNAQKGSPATCNGKCGRTLPAAEYRAGAPAFGDEGPPPSATKGPHLRPSPNSTPGYRSSPTATWTNRKQAAATKSLEELDGSVFAPLADVKDWELEPTA